ncbi:hypothetical protein KM043_009344 [Ampulex compressa]|nr:hypothetical protein KM043_009344 [Ampulex compressa]
MRFNGSSSLRWTNNKIDMSIFLFNGFLLLGFVVATVPDVMVLGSSGSTLVMDQEVPLKKCRYSRAYSMLQVRCTNLGFTAIPSDLKTDIQILDASMNRIRELTNESLAPYKNLAYIYLGDNFIQIIQEATFSYQHYLEVLDLSTNGLDDLPKSLLQLPYLRKVYLADNKFADTVFKFEAKSPLVFLQLSKNKLTRIPDLGLVPTLSHLNLSENTISSLTTEDLAPFCFLKVLDLSRNPIRFENGSCECQSLASWLKMRAVRSLPEFNCTLEAGQRCAAPRFSNRTLELYEKCTDVLRLQVESEKARSTWILVACCVGGFIFCVFVGLFCIHKRNKRRRRKLKEQQRLTVNNANTELLNSNLTQNENT